MARNRWIELTESNPGHSAWYIERFRSMAAAGDDLEGEARFVDAMVPRRSRILDAGCRPGRVGGYLARGGHDVVSVDIDPILIDAAKQEHPPRRGSSPTSPNSTSQRWASSNRSRRLSVPATS